MDGFHLRPGAAGFPASAGTGKRWKCSSWAEQWALMSVTSLCVSGSEVRVLPGQLSGSFPPAASHRGHSRRSLPVLVSPPPSPLQSHLASLSSAAHVCLCVVRLLKDNLQDSQFSARYQHLLAALLCCVGRGLREEFDRQCWLVSILARVAHKVREATPSSRQVMTPPTVQMTRSPDQN